MSEQTKERVTTLGQLRDLAYAKRAVVVPSTVCWAAPRPAAFMLNVSGGVLLRLMERGMFVYERRRKEVAA